MARYQKKKGPAPVSAAQETAAANTMVNHALGNTGAKQHAWMVWAQAPAIPRSQPSPAKTGTPTKRRVTTVQAENQIASNPASPQLANIIPRQAASTLPSPSPSEEATMDNAPTSLNMSAGTSAPSTGPPLNFIPGHPSPRTITAEGLQQASSLPNRLEDAHAESTRPVASEHARLGVNATESRSIPPALGLQVPLQQHPESRQASLNAQSMTAAMSPIPTQDLSPSFGHQQPQFHLPDPYNPAPQRDLNHRQAQVQTDRTPPQSPHLWAPIDALNPDTQVEYVQRLEQFIRNYTVPPTYPQEGFRLMALKNAILNCDWNFVIIHQYFCLLTAASECLPLEVRNDANRASTITLMSKVFDANDNLSPRILHFFCNSPMPMYEANTVFSQWRNLSVSTFKRFMSKSRNYEGLTRRCQNRNYPLMTLELVDDLGIDSMILQQTVFNHLSRLLWVSWGVPDQQCYLMYEQRNCHIFINDQYDFYQNNNLLHKELRLQLKGSCDDARRMVQQRFLGPHPSRQPMPPPASQPMQQAQQAQHFLPTNYDSARFPPSQAFVPSMSAHPAQAAIQRGGIPGGGVIRPESTSEPRPLLPKAGVRLQPLRTPEPGQHALHQAYLRSPVLRALPDPSMLYQFVEGFVIPPRNLTDIGRKIEKWTFNLTHEVLELIPKDLPGDPGAPPVRNINETSRMFRIRCVKWNPSQPFDEHTWAVADTCWIPYSYFTINRKDLQQRKKIHHGKDLPIDITAFVKEGENTLEIAVLPQQHDVADQNYMVAIETLQMKSHAEIIRECSSNNSVSASVIIENITHKLDGTINDEELSIVGSHLNINLFDPFITSKFCDVPVRGKACSHHECFDLETFLKSRQRKGDAATADQWKCPICKGDARPHILIVDGFLMEVYQQLKQQGLTKTRVIVVDQSGAWRPKPEDRDPHSVRDRRSLDENLVLDLS